MKSISPILFPRRGHGFFDTTGNNKLSFNFFQYFSKHCVDLPNLSDHYVCNGFVRPLSAFFYKRLRVIIVDAVLPCRYSTWIFRTPYFEIVLSQKIAIIF